MHKSSFDLNAQTLNLTILTRVFKDESAVRFCMSSQDTQRKTQQLADESKSGIQSGSNTAKAMASRGEESIQKGQDTSGSYMESAKNKVGEMKDRAMNSAQGVWGGTKEQAQNAENLTSDYMRSAQDQSGQMKDATMSRMGEARDAGKEKSQSMMGSTEKGLGDAWQDVKDTFSGSQGDQQKLQGHNQPTGLNPSQGKAGVQEQHTFTDRVKEAASQAKNTLFGSK
jgi:hypothetical protein